MSYKLVIKEEARADIAIAYDYYETQQQGLGDRFLFAVEQRLLDISLHPEYYSYVAADTRRLLRDVAVHKFPYLVVYRIRGSEVVVYGVQSTHKKPRSKYSS